MSKLEFYRERLSYFRRTGYFDTANYYANLAYAFSRGYLRQKSEVWERSTYEMFAGEHDLAEQAARVPCPCDLCTKRREAQ